MLADKRSAVAPEIPIGREQGIEPVTDSGPKPTREFIAREVATLAPVIKAANIVAE